MIHFFRKERWRLAQDNQFLKYGRYAIGEIALVVVGILIALQVNNWNEDKNTQQIEHKLLKELKTDLEETRADLLTDMEKNRLDLKVTDSLYQLARDIQSGASDQPVRISMEFLYNRPDLFPKNSAYESLQAFGINLVSNDSLRKGITDLYELQLVRVDVLEKYIKEMLEKEFVPYLMKSSVAEKECADCSSLEGMFSPNESLNANYYQVEKPEEQLLHLLKTKYLTYSALTGLYTTTEEKIDRLIRTIDAETRP